MWTCRRRGRPAEPRVPRWLFWALLWRRQQACPQRLGAILNRGRRHGACLRRLGAGASRARETTGPASGLSRTGRAAAFAMLAVGPRCGSVRLDSSSLRRRLRSSHFGLLRSRRPHALKTSRRHYAELRPESLKRPGSNPPNPAVQDSARYARQAPGKRPTDRAREASEAQESTTRAHRKVCRRYSTTLLYHIIL